jgi:putative IMPACT (imprinted ancient) family translation regulator
MMLWLNLMTLLLLLFRVVVVAAPSPSFQFTQSELITDRKSKFRAFATRILSSRDARVFVKFLDTVDRRVGDATHRMLVWKTGGLCGRDDDGETGAGDRVLFLIDRLRLDGVAVCIVRWYGGIQLGADRFKHISNAAREALIALQQEQRSLKE